MENYLLDTVKICSFPEIPPFTDESVLQVTFKLMVAVVMLVMMMILATLIFHQNLHPNKIRFEPNLNLMF